MRTSRLRFLNDANPDGTPGAPVILAPRTFTQEEVNALTTREKDQGRVAALREATEQLGGLTIADAAILVAAARAAETANQTETERALSAATATNTAATADREAAKLDRHAARLERILGTAGAVDVATAVRALDVAVGADEATVTAAVTAFKAKVPAFFTGIVIPHTDPPKPPAGGGGLGSATDRATAIAAARGYAKPA